MTNIQQIIKESKFISETKKILIEDCFSQLEGVYGLQKNGVFEDITFLPNLKEDSFGLKIRKKLEEFVEYKTETGESREEAIRNLTKEYAFTYLNRFVALKMMEERKIIKQIVSRGFNSNAFIFYLADNLEDEKLWKQGKVYQAYKNFFYWQCKNLSRDEEIKVLFDPESVVGLLFPTEKALIRIFELINQDELAIIWREDEVIGWTYQYFVEDEKKEVFNKIYGQKKKMDLRDIASATQIFTPKWIVKFLVENTLGRLWIKIHPDTKLKEKLKYYVPNENDSEKISLKPAKEITLLDPACGTMHFGMVAFDLFYEMYLEELQNAGKPGWLQKSSLDKEKNIPSAIIENNLFGIDIDLRAIQLSALSLYLKAKIKDTNVSIQKYNLVHTDISNFSEETINNFINSISYKYELTGKLLQKVLPELRKAYYLGSLLKIEEIINKFLSEHKKRFVKRYGVQQELFMTEGERQLFLKQSLAWREVKEELMKAVNEFIKKTNNGNFIARESKKGIYLMDALMKKHDVVVTNPPYSGRRNWNSQLRSDLKNIYPKKDNDLYAVFIDRCLELTSQGGFCGMVTIHSFMFTSSHKQIREEIIKNTVIESFAHLGTKTEFDVANKTAQGFAMYILGKYESSKISSKGVYFRLVDENEEQKRIAFEESLNKYLYGKKSDKVFIIEQEKLKAIPGWPFVYWVSDRIRELFEGKLLGSVADPKNGNQSCYNMRFLRFWWEAGLERIMFGCDSRETARHSLMKWFPYMKGGEINKWYGNQYHVINYFDNGREMRDFRKKVGQSDSLNAEDYYFREGATYSALTISSLSVRYLPIGFMFDMAGSSIFPKKTGVYLLLSVLNSKLSTFLIKVLNPTVNYEIGDIARIPFPNISKDSNFSEIIEEKVKQCIQLKKELVKMDEISWEFEKLPSWDTGFTDILEKEKELAILETEISNAVYELYNIHQDDIEQIEKEFGKLPGNLKKVSDLNSEESKVIESLYLQKHVYKEALKRDREIFIDNRSENQEVESQRRGRGVARYLTLEEICLASGFYPEVVFEYIKHNKLERDEERYKMAVKYVSYAVGALMGKFEVGGVKPDDDGVLVFDEGHTDDVPIRVREVLEKILGNKRTEEVIRTLGGNLRKFLISEFFIKHHLKIYKKRPIYWLFLSGKKNYGFYIYNLKFTQDTLYSLINKYTEPKINFEKSRLSELHIKKDKVEGREKRDIEKLIVRGEELLEELEHFKKDINEVIALRYKPNIDDGVILNMAPLYKLMPWKEPEKYYKELQEGKYEWSQISRIFREAI